MLREGESVERLEGGLEIIQNERYYRFTSDSLLLSRFARAKAGDAVADLCAGGGVVGLHFLALHPQSVRSVTLFEMQAELSEMSGRTIARNGLGERARAVCARVQDIASAYNEAFSLALCNPPYERGGFDNADPRKALCRKEIALTLPELLDCARRILKFGGRLALVHREDRLAEVLSGMKVRGIEPKRLQLVSGRPGAKPYLFLAEGVKGGKEGIEVLPAADNARGDAF